MRKGSSASGNGPGGQGELPPQLGRVSTGQILHVVSPDGRTPWAIQPFGQTADCGSRSQARMIMGSAIVWDLL